MQQAEQSAAEKDIRDTEDADQTGTAESSEENQSEEQADAAETTVSSTGTATAGKVYQQYTVKEGDTLLKISRNYYQDAEHVKAIIQLCPCRAFPEYGKKVDGQRIFHYTECIIGGVKWNSKIKKNES